MFVHTGRHTVQSIEGVHKSGCSGISSSLKGRQHNIPKSLFTHIYCIVIAAAFCKTISGKVFDACCQRGFVGQVISLNASYSGRSDLTAQKGIFAGTFHNSPPARIAGNIHHRREGPVLSIGSGFGGSDAFDAFNQIDIPGCRLRQRNRENGFIPVNYIKPEDDGDFQTAFHRRSLYFNLVVKVCMA